MIDSYVYNICKRSSTSGSIVDTIISQSNWNLDTMDYNGISRLSLD